MAMSNQNETMGELIYLPRPRELTPEQKTHWETELEQAERRVEDCMRILGYLALEEGLEGL